MGSSEIYRLMAERSRKQQELSDFLKKRVWPVRRGVEVDGLHTLHSERIKEVQSENPDLALVLPDVTLTASFQVGEEFLAAVDSVLKDWSVRLGDLIRAKKNRKMLQTLNLSQADWIHGTYLLCGEPVSYKEVECSIRN
jgi:hypothetical protein